jgi:hypothetical protein
MLLQLQDYGTSLWQLDYYATTLAGLLGSGVMVALAQGATPGFCGARGGSWPTAETPAGSRGDRSLGYCGRP